MNIINFSYEMVFSIAGKEAAPGSSACNRIIIEVGHMMLRWMSEYGYENDKIFYHLQDNKAISAHIQDDALALQFKLTFSM
jgi:hypothetical protein